MSIHEYLSKDSSWHSIHQKQYGINYTYMSNIQEDEIFSIITYTMPKEVQKTMTSPIYHSMDVFYIVVGYDEGLSYYLILSLAQSQDLNLSHTEVLRIRGQKSIENLITKYLEVIQDKKFTVKATNAITGGAVQLPLYIY